MSVDCHSKVMKHLGNLLFLFVFVHVLVNKLEGIMQAKKHMKSCPTITILQRNANPTVRYHLMSIRMETMQKENEN